MCSENNCRGNFNYLQRENCPKYAENSRKKGNKEFILSKLLIKDLQLD